MTKNQEPMNDSPKSGGKLRFILFPLILPVISSLCLLCTSLTLPSFEEQANKAKQSEAKQYVGSMNRAQQSKYAENDSFVNSIDALGIGIKTETTNYRYSMETTKNTAFNYGVAKSEKLRSFVGGVFVIGVKSDNAQNKMRIESILCITDEVGIIHPKPPQTKNGKLVC